MSNKHDCKQNTYGDRRYSSNNNRQLRVGYFIVGIVFRFVYLTFKSSVVNQSNMDMNISYRLGAYLHLYCSAA